MDIQRDDNRFFVETQGNTAEVEYSISDDLLIIHHTEVPSAIENQGIASSLLTTVARYAKENNLLIKAKCRFAKDYMERKEEFMGLLAKH